MQTCYNCGKEVEDNVLICPECGALVKRYDAPVREDAEAPAQKPAANLRAGVYVDGSGKLRLRTAVKVWLILGVVYALYTAFAFGCMLQVYHNPDVFLTPLKSVPELAQLVRMVEEVLAVVSRAYVLFLLYPLFFLLKAAASVWFLCSKRRLAFCVLAGAGALILLCTLVTGSLFGALLNVLDVIVAWGLLKPGWGTLKP